MIPRKRFIETSDNYEAWLAARRGAVTATEVAKAATPAGFEAAVSERLNRVEVIQNDFMRFGSEHEVWLAEHLEREFGVRPNRWLIASADNPTHMATPDGLSEDHTRMAEIKTGGQEPPTPPVQHLRQMAWQFRCNEFAEEIVYAFLLRKNVNGVLMPAWPAPRTWIVRRDEALIEKLIRVADRLVAAVEERTAA